MAQIDVDQWAGLVANVGWWQGEFIRLDPQRQECSRTASRIRLEVKGERHIEQLLDIGGQTQTLQITSLKKGLVFFPSGAFSQGSLQWSPIGEFAVELSLLAGLERRRLVAIYRAEQQQSHLATITLIPEYAQAPAPVRPELVGSEPVRPETTSLAAAQSEMIQIDTFWQVECSSQRYSLTDEPLPYQCACALPLVLPKQKPFSLGLSWRVNADEQQHLVRHYDASGVWQSVCWYRQRF